MRVVLWTVALSRGDDMDEYASMNMIPTIKKVS